MEHLGFVASLADSSLFIFINGYVRIYLVIYVDYLLITCNALKPITSLITNLGRLFSTKDLGHVHYFLGMKVNGTLAGLSLTQTKYVMDLFHRTNLHESKLVSTPGVSYCRFSLHDGEP